MCVFFPFILDIKFVGRTSRGHTGFFIHLLSAVVVVVVFFTLTDRASTIPSNTRGCQSGTWSAGQKKIRGTSTSSNESKRKTQTHKKNDKEKGTGITKYTGQKKINEGHSIQRVWHSASREPSDTLPGSQPCTQKRVASTTFRTLRVAVFTNGTIDVAEGVLGLAQSTRFENVSSLLQSHQVQPQPCPPLPLPSSSAVDWTHSLLPSPTRP